MEELSEVAESEAEGKVRAIFEDVRSTMGIPSVGALFRRLAAYPWFLQLAWTNLKPNASVAYFYRAVAELEAATLGHGHGSKVKDPHVEYQARLFMVTGALRAGTNGQVPKMNWLSAEDRRITAPTVIAPEVLDTSDEVLASTTASAEVKAQAEDLRRKVAMSVENLPYRMEISATACRQAGLREDQIETVKRIIDSSWWILPEILVAMAEKGSAHTDTGEVGRREAVAAG